MVQRSREKEQKQQHINETENILLKSYTKTGVRNYDHKSFKRSGIMEFLAFLKIPGMSRIQVVAGIRTMRSSTDDFLVHQTFHMTRTRLTSPSIHPSKGRVIWNTPVPVTSLVQLPSIEPITIHSSIHDLFIFKFFV
ncbi:hypothetical protein TNCV_753071 [Trichonephila clavipes]|uniref:Uncharacterized protein n=1 Tax=Trichonephila clavipes TaxID=2585209 RepID=A0A8X6WBF9_TRICX|nr:hypothetical protein TNCV_753071 [Trichonephila clavipes]